MADVDEVVDQPVLSGRTRQQRPVGACVGQSKAAGRRARSVALSRGIDRAGGSGRLLAVIRDPSETTTRFA